MQKFVVAIIHLKEPTGLCRSCCRSLGVCFQGRAKAFPHYQFRESREKRVSSGNREN